MAIRVHPELPRTLEKFGLQGSEACYHCGNCTATCDLTGGGEVFPRRAIRQVQLGLKDSLDSSVEPWLCYYCGECTTQCPREADPASQMMAFRRYLTSVYDWTGLSARLYASHRFELGAVAAVGLLVVALFAVFHLLFPGNIPTELAVAPDGSTYVPLNTFAPVKWIHLGDWVLAGLLLTLLLGNLYNMYRRILGGPGRERIPLWLWLREARQVVVHFVTQKRFGQCDTERKPFWAWHLVLMSGYVIMFSLVMLLLPQFQIDAEGVNWTTFLGYYATVTILGGCAYFAVGRIRKREEIHKESHFSDWLFLALLTLTAVTGIAVHAFRYFLEWPVATYLTYVVHLAVACSMFVVEVPFGKWAHLAYRPVAIYFAELRRAAQAQRPVSRPAAAKRAAA
jgi:nitrate reductase gamma subunit